MADEKNYLIEHMKMTQSIITRMNKNSFQLKGWMLTIVAAFLAIYGSASNIVYIWIAIAPTVVFWMLDSFYLREERKYVDLYGKLVDKFNGNDKTEEIDLFDLSTRQFKNECRYCFWAVMFSKTERGLYLSVIVGLVIAGTVLTVVG